MRRRSSSPLRSLHPSTSLPDLFLLFLCFIPCVLLSPTIFSLFFLHFLPILPFSFPSFLSLPAILYSSFPFWFLFILLLLFFPWVCRCLTNFSFFYFQHLSLVLHSHRLPFSLLSLYHPSAPPAIFLFSIFPPIFLPHITHLVIYPSGQCISRKKS